MKDVFIVDGGRTAIGNFGGSLAGIGSVKPAVDVIEVLLNRNNLEPESVDEVIMGNIYQAGQGANITRQILVNSGIPVERTGMTINMLCGSGLRSVTLAAQSIQCGDANIAVVGGTENMSDTPYLLSKARNGYYMGNGEIVDSMLHDGLVDVFNNYHMGVTAENLAEKYSISREEQDQFACDSQNKTEKAFSMGKFIDEIIPISIPQRKKGPMKFEIDEFPRSGMTVESLSKLHPAFKKDGTVTAGNASGINDGASCLILAGEESVANRDLKPMARIVSYAYHGTDPSIMGIGPVEAVRIALRKAGWCISDLQLIESNEAFAAQAISVNRELGWNNDLVNVNGGAISLGHPVGASGARILVTLLHEMKREKLSKGLATLCIGGGMGIAMCVEAL